MIENWKELNIGKYQEICRVTEMPPENEMEAVNQQVEILAILSGMSPDDVENLPVLEYMDMRDRSAFLDTEIPVEQKDYRKDPVLVLGGKRYEVVLDVTKMTAKQFIAYQMTAKNLENDIVPFLSTMIIPEGKQFESGYSIDEAQKDIREGLSIAEAKNLSSFFLRSLQGFIRSTLTCLEKRSQVEFTPEMKDQIKTLNQALESLSTINGDGGRE